MSIVRMLTHIGGYRDGAPWPAVGGLIDVPATEAVDLIVAGYAEEATDAPSGEHDAVPVGDDEQAPDPEGNAVPVGDDEPTADPAEEVTAPVDGTATVASAKPRRGRKS